MPHTLLRHKRICLIGPSSSGKTTLGRKLAEKLNVPFLSLDKLNFDPNWTERPLENFHTVHTAWMQKEEWVIEGNYSRTIPQRFEKAEVVIYFQLNRFGALFRYLRRMLMHYGKQRQDAPDGCYERMNWNMVHHILVYSPQRMARYTGFLAQHPHLKVYHLRRFADVKKLYADLGIPWGQ